MVEIVISVAAKVAEYLVAPIVRQFSYVWNYKTNFQNLETEVGKLKGKQDEVQHSVDDAIRNGEEIHQHVIDWLDTVKKKVDEVSQEIIQEKGEQANMKCFNGLCPNPMKLHQHSRKAVRKANSIVELQQGNFQNVAYRIIPKEIWIPSSTGYKNFESRMSTLEKILNALSNPDVNMLSIYGLGGIGKTTLAREVAKHAEENELFDVVAFTEVSVAPDIKKIQEEIAEMLGLTFRESTVTIRASKLHEYLKQGGQKKKILLVLDNIWATSELHKVGIPFGDDCKGCKVLLTARDLDALTSTGSQLNFSMDVLNDQEAWALFSTTVGDCIEQKRDLQVLAEEVAKACGGLPIAIVTIAKALRNKKDFEWMNALKEMKKPSPRTLKGVAGPTYSCIEFSYNQLNDEELKSIFLLCSTMESTDNASIGDLMKYGMGLRIFEGINRIIEARHRVDTLVRKLKDASLLLDTPNNGSFSMHATVRAVGRLIASRNQHVVIVMDDNVRKDWDDDDTLKTSTRIFLHKIRELPKELECQHLEFLYMQTNEYTLAIPDNFFTKMSKLRVLHLIGFDLSSLPTSLCLLENLQTLYMDYCKVKDIALIGELKKLEILSIDGDYYNLIMRLPEEVRKLTGLRLLDLSTCEGLEEIPPNIIASLTQLEELYLYNSYHRWEVQGGSNACLDELKFLPHLTVLEIQIPNTDVLSKGLFSKNLEMYNISIGQSSDNFKFQENWPKTSRKLELNLGDNCSCLEDVLHKMPSVKNVLSALDEGEGFPKLKQLWVHSSSCFRTVADCSESESYYPFPSLETLFLEELINLEKIYNGKFGAEFFCQLRNIKVQKCDKLKNIFSFSTIRDLPLEEIEVCDCANIKEIFAVGKEEDIIHLKELRSITLEGLPQLTSLCSINNNEVILEDTPTATFNGKVEFPNLKTLKLGGINFEQIWHNQLLAMPFCVQSLQELTVWNCHKLKYLFSSPTVGFPSLEKMAISGMDNLESIWHNPFLGDSFSFPKLKSVEVNDCQELKTIFPSCICGRLPRLESLTVKSCGLVEEIFNLQWLNLEEKHSIEATTQLRELYVDHMSKLKRIWNKDPKGMLSYGKLQKVTVFLCPNLENLFPASVAKSLLNLVSLDVSDCGLLEEIIATGGVKEDADRLLFPKLSSLQLHNLPQLRTFCTGQTVELSCLKRLGLHHCDNVKLFISEFLGFYETIELEGTNQGLPNLEELHLSGKEITMEWLDQVPGHVFRSVKSLELNELESTVLPLHFIQKFGSMGKLSLNSSSYMEISSYGEVKEHPQIKHLVLGGLFDLKQIWKQGLKIDPKFQNLEILEVRSCFNLINLMPSSVSFQNLMILEVWGCDGLKNLLTSSTAKSLVLLEKLELFDCKMLIEVVANEGAETEEINFRKLKSLSLMYLQSLASFCSMKHILNFPILESLVVNECPKMKIFSDGVMSTPELHKLELNWEACEQSWEVGVNATIKQNMEKR